MTEQTTASPALNKWLRILSPCVIAMAFCLFVLLLASFDFDASDPWNSLIIFAYLFVSGVLLLMDFLVKRIIKTKVLYVWLAELVLIVAGVFIFYAFY